MKIVISLFLLCPVLLFGQPRTSVDVFGAAGYAQVYNSFLREFDFGVTQQSIDVYRGGIGGSHALGQHFSIRVGFQATQYGFRFRQEVTFTDVNGSQINSSPVVGTSDTRFTYLESLIGLRYHINTYGRWSPFVEVGMNAGLFVKGASTFKVDPQPNNFIVDGEEFDDENVHTVGTIGRAGIGTDYSLNERFNLYGMVAFQHHLSKNNVNPEARVLPWQATLELGFRYFVGFR